MKIYSKSSIPTHNLHEFTNRNDEDYSSVFIPNGGTLSRYVYPSAKIIGFL